MARWEGLPLTSLEDVGDLTEGGPSLIDTVHEEGQEDDEAWYKNPKKVGSLFKKAATSVSWLPWCLTKGVELLGVLEEEDCP